MWCDPDLLEPVVNIQNVGTKMCGHETGLPTLRL